MGRLTPEAVMEYVKTLQFSSGSGGSTPAVKSYYDLVDKPMLENVVIDGSKDLSSYGITAIDNLWIDELMED